VSVQGRRDALILACHLAARRLIAWLVSAIRLAALYCEASIPRPIPARVAVARAAARFRFSSSGCVALARARSRASPTSDRTARYPPASAAAVTAFLLTTPDGAPRRRRSPLSPTRASNSARSNVAAPRWSALVRRAGPRSGGFQPSCAALVRAGPRHAARATSGSPRRSKSRLCAPTRTKPRPRERAATARHRGKIVQRQTLIEGFRTGQCSSIVST
jgi:hypothetical protein